MPTSVSMYLTPDFVVQYASGSHSSTESIGGSARRLTAHGGRHAEDAAISEDATAVDASSIMGGSDRLTGN